MRGSSFDYVFADDAKDVRFCFAFPYVKKNLDDFLKTHSDNPHLKVETLCKSRKGRPIPVLHLGRLDGNAKYRIALTCRHHCCETMASYVLEGIIDAVLADTPEGKWFRENVEFFIVPMVDFDGVQDGDQGKNRRPRDHNRDYEGKSLYPSVAAIRERLPAWSRGKMRIAMDMHCPHIRGGSNETVFFVGGPNQKVWEQIRRLSKILESVGEGPLPHHSKNNIPFGQGWNNQKNYAAGKPFSRWAAELPGVEMATTLETAYANASGEAVTDQSARALGRDLAKTFQRFLQPEQ